MDMNNWKPYLHTHLLSDFKEGGEAFLFPSFLVTNNLTFLGSAVFTAVLALVERLLTSILDSQSKAPSYSKRKSSKSKQRTSLLRPLLRTFLYFCVTLLRYILMIISMGMDWFILLVIVISLSVGQFVIEWRKEQVFYNVSSAYQLQPTDAVKLITKDEDDNDDDVELFIRPSSLDHVAIEQNYTTNDDDIQSHKRNRSLSTETESRR